MDRRLSTLPYPPIPYCVTFFKRCLFVTSIIYNCLCYDPCRPSYDPTNLLDGIYSMDYQVGPRSNLSKRPSPSTFPLEFLYLGRGTRYDSQLGVTLYLSPSRERFLARSRPVRSRIRENRGKLGQV